jgi:cytochrome c-type biogenesis protein
VVSFLSPCVLPILPGYLAYVGSMALGSAPATEPRGARLLAPVGLFVLGFGTVFIALGMTASLLGSFLTSNQSVISKVAGALIILMGLAFMGLVPIPFLMMEKRFQMHGGKTLAGNYVMGAAFGFGWTPCIGPTLGATLLIASQAETAGHGALLLAVYSLGLGIPFILAALGVSRVTGALTFFRKHQRAVMICGGGILVAFGTLMLFDKVFVLSSAIQKWMQSAGLGSLIGI